MSTCDICDLELIIGKMYKISSETYTCVHCNDIQLGLKDRLGTYLGLDYREHVFKLITSVTCPICGYETKNVFRTCFRDDFKKGKEKPNPIPPNNTSPTLADDLFSFVLHESTLSEKR